MSHGLERACVGGMHFSVVEILHESGHIGVGNVGQ